MYSKELINEVKRLYPESKVMQQLAEKGDAFLGRYLDDSCSNSIPLDTVINAKSLHELQEQALNIKQKIALYNQWYKEDSRKQLNKKL